MNHTYTNAARRETRAAMLDAMTPEERAAFLAEEQRQEDAERARVPVGAGPYDADPYAD